MKDSSTSTSISVVMPAFNAELYIAESIQSILEQSFDDFELIIIDDASTDRTLEILNKYVKKDSRIRVFSNEKNLGIAGNRNLGVSLALGKYLAWQDADDIALPYRLEQQYQFLEAHPEVGIVGGYLELFSGNNIRGVRRYAEGDFALRKSMFKYSPIAQPAAMIRKDILDRAGIYDLSYPPAEDLDMTFRIGMLSKLANIPKILIRYRVSATSATGKNLKTMELNTLRIRRKYLFRVPYQASTIDIAYNLAHFLSIYLVPGKWKIKLFSLLRDAR
jgi:glycosyltransferase involved in cell wall biosynthesis